MDESINVLAVGDSQAALHLLTEVQPDLILLDREMTFREGLHLPARMRQILLRADPFLYAVVSNSNSDEKTASAGMD